MLCCAGRTDRPAATCSQARRLRAIEPGIFSNPRNSSCIDASCPRLAEQIGLCCSSYRPVLAGRSRRVTRMTKFDRPPRHVLHQYARAGAFLDCSMLAAPAASPAVRSAGRGQAGPHPAAPPQRSKPARWGDRSPCFRNLWRRGGAKRGPLARRHRGRHRCHNRYPEKKNCFNVRMPRAVPRGLLCPGGRCGWAGRDERGRGRLRGGVRRPPLHVLRRRFLTARRNCRTGYGPDGTGGAGRRAPSPTLTTRCGELDKNIWSKSGRSTCQRLEHNSVEFVSHLSRGVQAGRGTV